MSFRFVTAGESHGPGLTAIVEGLPAGLELAPEDIDADLARRQLGHGRGGRMKIEKDRAEVTAGVRHGRTLGSPVCMWIQNRDYQNWEERINPWPSWRRARSASMSSGASSSPAGSPSTMAVSPGPWDSPAVTNRKDIAPTPYKRGCGRQLEEELPWRNC